MRWVWRCTLVIFQVWIRVSPVQLLEHVNWIVTYTVRDSSWTPPCVDPDTDKPC